MSNYKNRGLTLREQAKSIVLDFMQNNEACKPYGKGATQMDIFRECGFDWGDVPKAKSNNQVSWLNALMWKLCEDKKVERVHGKKNWRLVNIS